MTTMAIIVTGAREGARQTDVSRALDAWHSARPVGLLIHGDCEDPKCERPRQLGFDHHDDVVQWQTAGRYPHGLSVDRCAEQWARHRSLRWHAMPADWYPHRQGFKRGPMDRAAGPKRNRRMAQELRRYQQAGRKVAVLAFPGGNGTADMVRVAKSLGLPVWRAVDGQWRRDDGV